MPELSDELMVHLPFLRRFARALTGSMDQGDDLVASALEAVLAPPAGTESARDRKALYGQLVRLFDAQGGVPEAAATQHPLERALGALPERQRRLYLLVNVEELSAQDAAAILGITAPAARELLAEAQEGLREALIADILIVEDDAIIAFDLAETVRGMGHHVCGTAATMDAALATARSHQPTLALMDLRLAHGDSGIVTAQALRQRSALPIIFVTAFGDELARRGLEHLGPVIQKPFTREQIERAITQAVFAPPAKQTARRTEAAGHVPS
jgi:DNA-directed RNA polymerase specialized sigma24 family protein/CheY-like chemotaxis protein